MKERLRALDRPLLWIVALLCLMGTLTVYSAGRDTVLKTLWVKELGWNLMGFLCMAFLVTVPPKRIFRWSLAVYILGLLSLLAVFAVGRKLGGAQRWIQLGSVTLQPSELMKWIALLFVSHRLGVRPPDAVTGAELVGAAGLVLFPMLLVMKQPDLGMALSFLPILLLVPLMRGLRWRWVALGAVLVVAGGFFAYKKVLKPYQKQRIQTFLDPSSDIKGKGYQINQSRIAIGAGGFLGRGFTSGSQTQLNYLPVKTTDFVFAVWAEERGFLGVLLALGLFGALLLKLLEIGRQAKAYSELYFCTGAAAIFAMHLFVNVGMVAGALPNKGIALPFFSYGGSSTLSFFLALGVVMSIRHHGKVK